MSSTEGKFCDYFWGTGNVLDDLTIWTLFWGKSDEDWQGTLLPF